MFSAATKTAAAAGGYQISRSLRFNSADSTNLTRTPASASNRKTWTWSGWVKRSGLADAYQAIFEVFNGNNDNQTLNINFQGSSFGGVRDAIAIGAYNVNWLVTTAVYRDPSAWYHIVLAVDTTQATANNRIRLYVNGSEVTAFGTRNNPTQNDDLAVNQSAAHYIGSGNARTFFNGYLTEINFIDGQQLTPSSFGETSTQTGVWQPKAYSGSYGTNGYYLNFSDNSNTTAATLGKDYSGNGNNWTPNNFSVAAGVGNDSMVDTPTPYGGDTGAGGEVRGNYCTLNSLTTSAGTYTQGNLRYVGDSNWRRSSGTTTVSTGKWYWEVTIGNSPNPTRSVNSAWNAFGFGVPPLTVGTSSNPINGLTDVLVYGDNGYANNFGTTSGDLGAVSSGDVLSIAVDLDANSYTLRKNNSQVATGTIGGTAGRTLVPVVVSYNGDYGVMDCNFGQRAFAYTAPSGFQALCTQNLPTPTIGATTATQAGNYFVPTAYTGNGSSSRAITNGINMAANGGLVWTKQRSGVEWHFLIDNVRGNTKYLSSNSANAEGTISTLVTGFDSTGYSIGNDSGINSNGSTYVSWVWGAGGAGVTNTAGSLASTVSANTTSGFSIVTCSPTGSAFTVGHGLGSPPRFIISKLYTTGNGWNCYHASLGADKYVVLESSAQALTSTTLWQNTAPTSTVLSFAAVSTPMLFYCFAEVPGFSAFGTYTGNGNSDGPFVFTGFRPRYVLIKASSSVSFGNWVLHDTARSPSNVSDKNLYANLSNAEDGTYLLDILSNGFKLRSSAFDGTNGNGSTYIYAAFAENPFKYSLAR